MSKSKLTPFGELIDSISDNIAVIIMTTANLKIENPELCDLAKRDITGIGVQCTKIMNKLKEYGDKNDRG